LKYIWTKFILGGEKLTRRQKEKIKERAVESGYIPAVKILFINGKKIADFEVQKLLLSLYNTTR